MLRYGFEELKLNRVSAQVFTDNIGWRSGMFKQGNDDKWIANPDYYAEYGERRFKDESQIDPDTPHRVAYRHDGSANAVCFDGSAATYSMGQLWSPFVGRGADVEKAERLLELRWEIFKEHD